MWSDIRRLLLLSSSVLVFTFVSVSPTQPVIITLVALPLFIAITSLYVLEFPQREIFWPGDVWRCCAATLFGLWLLLTIPTQMTVIVETPYQVAPKINNNTAFANDK
jgi:hypothetical protein